jgi:carboxyl-terminal processing protease
MLNRILLRTLIVTALLAIGFLSGWISALAVVRSMPGMVGMDDVRQSGPASMREQFALFWEVWDLVEYEYYGRASLNRTAMIQGAVKGMLASLGDSATVYQEPDLAAQSLDYLQGKIGGIGTYLRITDGRAFLYKPLKDGPAYLAGLRQDDEIVAVDGEPVTTIGAGLDSNAIAVKVSAKLRGPEGTTVVVTIRRASDGAVSDMPLVRRDVVVPSVETQMFDGDVAYLRIAEFRGTTTKEFDTALAGLLSKQPRAMILDLRNNPGGLLGSAQEVLGRFYTGVALYQDDGAGAMRELQTTPGSTSVPAIPLVILVNSGSASASEIVAGALEERRPNTTTLGEKTYGKGSVQSVHTLSDKGSARITIAHWLTPEKHAIQGQGIEPQRIVPFADDPASLMPCIADRQPKVGQTLCGDTQLVAAMELIRSP